MKNYEAIVLLMAPLGTGLAAFDYGSGWDQHEAVAQRSPAPAAPPCPEPHTVADATGTCVPVIPATAQAGLAAR